MINQTRAFWTKLKRFSIKLFLQFTNVIKGTSRTNLYNELGIQSLSFHWWFRIFCTFYKIKTQCAPKYLYKLLPLKSDTYGTCSTHSVGTYFCRTNASKNYFFALYQSKTEYKVDLQLRNEKSCQKIRNTYFTSGCAIYWRRFCQNTTLWQSNFWWKWQSKNMWNSISYIIISKRFNRGL